MRHAEFITQLLIALVATIFTTLATSRNSLARMPCLKPELKSILAATESAPQKNRYFDVIPSPEILELADERVRAQLYKLGISYRPRSTSGTLLDLGFQIDGNPSLYERFKGSSFLYEIDASKLPIGKEPGLTVLALKHPKMAKYMEELKRNGFTVVIDSTLKYAKFDAYFHSSSRIIGISPKTSWQTFLHEYEHFRFYKSIDKTIGYDWLLRNAETLPKNFLRKLAKRDPVAARAVELAKKEMPRHGADETIAVEAELNALRNAGYKQWGKRYAQTKIYAIKNQIDSILKIPKHLRSPKQIAILKRAYAERIILGTLAGHHNFKFTVGVIGVLSTVDVVLLFKEEIGQFVGRLSDGRWFTTSVDDLLEEIRKQKLDEHLEDYD